MFGRTLFVSFAASHSSRVAEAEGSLCLLNTLYCLSFSAVVQGGVRIRGFRGFIVYSQDVRYLEFLAEPCSRLLGSD